MYLDVVSSSKDIEIIEPGVNGAPQTAEVYAKWKHWQPSQISHHGKFCCEIAREWVTATDFSELSGNCLFTGPRWLREKFNWGASSFPIYWCEAVRKKKLDCGALAALAHEIFTVRGVQSRRVQLVQRFSQVATNQWSCSWNEDGDEELRWIDHDLIYHEGCAILTGETNEIKVWDASAGWWVDSKASDGYGSLLAIRVSDELPTKFRWGNRTIAANRWTEIR
jgi:hypothetical protein